VDGGLSIPEYADDTTYLWNMTSRKKEAWNWLL
jgi:hypothetical protein